MKKVFQLLNLDDVTDGAYGIEIEAEGKRMQEVNNKFWRTEDDGSLRGRYPESRAEFVLNKPIAREEVKEAVQSLLKALPNAEFDFSFRTSVHVHMNVQDLTYKELLSVMYTYLLLEEPLTTYCGKERKGNRFCLRLADAEGLLHTMQMLFKGQGEGLRHIPQDGVRYSAINLEALRKYGSLEFRAMRGNACPETIDTWVGALDAIKKYAIGRGDPMAIYEDFRNQSPSAFLKCVLGDVSDSFLYPKLIRDIQRSYSLSMDLPHAYQYAEQQRKEAPPAKKAEPARKVKFDFGDIIAAHPAVAALNPRLQELMARAVEAQEERQAQGDW